MTELSITLQRNTAAVTRDKYFGISLLRITATLAVIFIHVCATLSDNRDVFVITNSQLAFLQIIHTWQNWAVPVFLMITGALLLKRDKTITPRMCLTRYVKRAAFALFLFGIPFAWMEIYFAEKTISLDMLLRGILSVISGESWDHLWYLYALIGVYLLLPLIKVFTDHSNRSELRYVLLVLFAFNFCMPLLEHLFDFDSGFTLPIVSHTVFYLLLGKYAFDETPSLLHSKKVDLAVIALILLLEATVVLYFRDYAFFGYESPFVAVMALLIFVSFKDFEMKNMKRIWKIDRLCFGVYLIHPVFINSFYKVLGITPVSVNWYIPMTFILFVVFTVLSFAASWVMSLIPPLKKHVL